MIFLAQIIVIVTTLLHFISPTLPTPLFYLLTTMPRKQVSSPALISHLRKEKGTGPKFVPELFLGSLLETHRSVIGILVSQKSLRKVTPPNSQVADEHSP